ncbi:MAG: RNA polymerase sigma factor [Actinomycetota bacterium]
MIRELRELIASSRTANISAPNTDIQAGTYASEEERLDRVPQLVEKAKRGDRDAFGDLYRLHHARIFRMARLHLGDLGDGAEDAVAETFLRAWAALPRYLDTGAPFVAWLFGIARHVVLDEVARGRRVMPREELPERTRGWTVDDRLTLAQAMDRLPTAQRQVVELKYLAGMRNEEVASALGKSKGAINAMQWRALGTLREILEER